MFEEQVLITRLQNLTGFPTDYANDEIGNTISSAISTRIYVGHVGIKLQDQQFLFANGYSELDNNELLITAIQIICKRIDFVTVRTAVRNAYRDFSPIDSADVSKVFFIEGNVLAKTGDSIWWAEHIGLLFPQIA